VRHLLDTGLDLQFHIVGGGNKKDWQRLLFTIEDLGLTGVVRLHGQLPPSEVRDIVRTSDVFVLPSLSEGISNAALEAMACGLPVVTTDCGGMREAVTDGVEGFVVPMRDPASMAGAIRLLAADVQLRERMGKAARAKVIAGFSVDLQTRRWIEFYHSLVSRRNAPVPQESKLVRL
jgi:glycosyltransferase involved in cell wall biosynthesis